MNKPLNSPWTVVDLFSGVGGMSYGFHAHPRFQIVGAVDAQIGKPSSGKGSLQCNLSYKANIGIEPIEADLATLAPKTLRQILAPTLGGANPTVLISCPPCTGFSRTNPSNHIVDDPRNSLVVRSALFVEELKPAIFLMENARELVVGNFTHHYHQLQEELLQLGYQVHGETLMLNRFGLPQRRERAIIIAVKKSLLLRTLEDLWAGFQINIEATYVRRAISSLAPVVAGKAHSEDSLHVAPSFSNIKNLRRLQLIPKDGGSWADLKDHQEAEDILTPAMLRYIDRGEFGSHPDVYGRLWWDRPAVTIKRECSHIGNGRYAHPEQNRLCTVREMSILQGFPKDYKFVASGRSNMYRQIGDAVPPIISYQLAKACEWILSGQKPSIGSVILPHTHLRVTDIEAAPEQQVNFELSPALI
ncbi:MAG TPA: DNA cytosine methyltransferase [Coleofasciculaceae cyanobacterium]|jgi:DNA (cytosine-5)-methyltransferase 1